MSTGPAAAESARRHHPVAPALLGQVQRRIGGGHQAASVGLFLRHPGTHADADRHPVGAMRDMHRVLVGAGDRLGNLAQIKTLLARGYQGCISYEPFAEEVAASDDIENQLRASMAHLRDGIGA